MWISATPSLGTKSPLTSIFISELGVLRLENCCATPAA